MAHFLLLGIVCVDRRQRLGAEGVATTVAGACSVQPADWGVGFGAASCDHRLGRGRYWMAAARSPLRHFILGGVALGVSVTLVMHFAVLPLSAVPFTIEQTTTVVSQGFGSHALLVVLPVSRGLEWLVFSDRAAVLK